MTLCLRLPERAGKDKLATTVARLATLLVNAMRALQEVLKMVLLVEDKPATTAVLHLLLISCEIAFPTMSFLSFYSFFRRDGTLGP